MKTNGPLPTKEGPLETIRGFLDKAGCPHCPGNERRAKEMLIEFQLVQEAIRLKQPIGPYVTRKLQPIPTTKPPKRQTQSVQVQLINLEPPSRWDRYWSYLKAKLPYMIGIRAPKRLVRGRRDMCTMGFLMCSKCGEFSIWDFEKEGFWCVRCAKLYSGEGLREMGQACPGIKQQGSGLFCVPCGCGTSRDANLAIKTKMWLAVCVLRHWPDSRPRRGSGAVVGASGRAKGSVPSELPSVAPVPPTGVPSEPVPKVPPLRADRGYQPALSTDEGTGVPRPTMGQGIR